MIVLEETVKDSRLFQNNSEIKLKARAVSRGVASGKIVCLYGRKRQFYRIQLKNSQIERETRRFQAAVRLAKRHLKKIQIEKNLGENTQNIFETHRLILEDKSLLNKIEQTIKEQKVNAEWAVKLVTDRYIGKYKALTDEHLREKYIDLEDIAERILTALGGGRKSPVRLKKNSIIVAKEVKPSTLIELAESQPKAIITENGGWTSHTFILAREMNLPAVTGLKGILRRVETGESAIVDGYQGQIIINPTAKTVKHYKTTVSRFNAAENGKKEIFPEKNKTLDGREIKIRANLDLAKLYPKAKKLGAQGIGLYRSEFLFNQFKGFPTENEQISAYRKIAELAGEEGVRIRTFDLSYELLVDESAEKEQNPALGLRGIRLSMRRRKQFQIQIRALLQASAQNKLDIILPMISDISEINFAKEMIRKEREYLKKRKINFGNPRLGAMIETPASVFLVDEIAREVEFICLGTNDLVQYILAVDRDNELVADWFRTLHPAVLRAVKKVLKAGEQNNIPVTVCGEMAGSPFYVPLLIGFGATELSMNINSISSIRKTISEIAFEEACKIAAKLGNCRTADEAELAAQEFFDKHWAHLFTQNLHRTARNGKNK